MKGDAEYERHEEPTMPTPTHELDFEHGPLVQVFLNEYGDLVFLVQGGADERYEDKWRGHVRVTVNEVEEAYICTKEHD